MYVMDDGGELGTPQAMAVAHRQAAWRSKTKRTSVMEKKTGECMASK